MIQTGHWQRDAPMDREVLILLLQKKFAEIDFELLKADVRPFIKDHRELDLWSRAFFSDIVLQIRVC